MLSKELEVTLNMAFKEAREQRHEFMTVEHLLLALLDNPTAAKVLRDWIKADKACPIAIKGGIVEGEAYVGDRAAELAELPDRDTINTKIVSAISGPARSMASVLNAVAGGMARCIQAKIDKGE